MLLNVQATPVLLCITAEYLDKILDGCVQVTGFDVPEQHLVCACSVGFG